MSSCFSCTDWLKRGSPSPAQISAEVMHSELIQVVPWHHHHHIAVRHFDSVLLSVTWRNVFHFVPGWKRILHRSSWQGEITASWHAGWENPQEDIRAEAHRGHCTTKLTKVFIFLSLCFTWCVYWRIKYSERIFSFLTPLSEVAVTLLWTRFENQELMWSKCHVTGEEPFIKIDLFQQENLHFSQRLHMVLNIYQVKQQRNIRTSHVCLTHHLIMSLKYYISSHKTRCSNSSTQVRELFPLVSLCFQVHSPLHESLITHHQTSAQLSADDLQSFNFPTETLQICLVSLLHNFALISTINPPI